MNKLLIEVNGKKIEVNGKLWNELNLLTKEIAAEEKEWNPFHEKYINKENIPKKKNVSNQSTLTQIYHVSGVKKDVEINVKNNVEKNLKKLKKKNILKQKDNFDFDEWFIHRKPKIYFDKNGQRVIDYSPPSLPEKVIQKAKNNQTLTQIYSKKKIPSNTTLSLYYFCFFKYIYIFQI